MVVVNRLLVDFTTRESHMYPRTDFSFVPGILPIGTNDCICTSWSHQPVQMSSHRGSSWPDPTQPVQMRLVAPTRTNVRQSHLHPLQMCNGYNSFVSPLPEPPPHSFPLSNSRPPPQWRPRELLHDCDYLSTISLIEVV
jgi:hypothetical protein